MLGIIHSAQKDKQFDQPRHDTVAFAVHSTAWHAVAIVDAGDLAMENIDLTCGHLLGQHKPRIGEMKNL